MRYLTALWDGLKNLFGRPHGVLTEEERRMLEEKRPLIERCFLEYEARAEREGKDIPHDR